MPVIPVIIAARDEESAIGACLDSLALAARVAEERSSGDDEGPSTLVPWVVLDECRDRTGEIAAARGVHSVRSAGGKVEAQRTGVRAFPDAPFHIFCDADVVVAPDTLAALCDAMREDPALQIAVPPKLPRPPRRRSPLAHALHVYNARRGFSTQRTWFSGKLFAIRAWAIPGPGEIARRAATLRPSAFHDYAAPLRVDDVFLSRAIVHAHGPRALRETEAGAVYFRAPETLVGMYRYYRRMRRELARIDALFPELSATQRAYGARAAELDDAPLEERAAYGLFQLALLGCRVAYRLERSSVDRLGRPPGDPWPVVLETK